MSTLSKVAEVEVLLTCIQEGPFHILARTPITLMDFIVILLILFRQMPG
jgi:hypothetical protein